MSGGQSYPHQKGRHAAESTKHAAADTDRHRFPQTFQLNGKSCEGQDFCQGATVTRKKPKSDVVIRNVDEVGVIYRTGIRDGDILEKVNGAEVQSLDLPDLVTTIGKLDTFNYFVFVGMEAHMRDVTRRTYEDEVLRRQTLKIRKRQYIHVSFNCAYSTESGNQEVDIKLLAAYYGVRRDEALYFHIPIYPLNVYRRVNGQRAVRVRTVVGEGDVRFLNTDPEDKFVEFTQSRVNLTQHLYLNLQTPNDVATVLCPTGGKCIKANRANVLSVGAKGKLEKSYTELDDRFFILEATNSKLTKLRSYYNPGYFVTVDVSQDNRGIMSKSGVHEFKVIEQ